MGDEMIRRFLRYYWKDLVDFALDIANLSDNELEAVSLCGRRGLTIEKAAEIADVSVNTMQTRWSNARKRLGKAWAGIDWISVLANTVDN